VVLGRLESMKGYDLNWILHFSYARSLAHVRACFISFVLITKSFGV